MQHGSQAGNITHGLHQLLFNLPADARLSAQAALSSPYLALVPAIGGLLIDDEHGVVIAQPEGWVAMAVR